MKMIIFLIISFIAKLYVFVVVICYTREDFYSTREYTLDVSSGTDILKILYVSHVISRQWDILGNGCIGN